MDIEEKALEEVEHKTVREGVNCPTCRRMFGIPPGADEGLTLRCPFCSAHMILRRRTLLVAEPVEAA